MPGSHVTFSTPAERLQYIEQLCAIMSRHGVTQLNEGELTIVLPPKPGAPPTLRPATLQEQVEAIASKDADTIDAYFQRAKINGGISP